MEDEIIDEKITFYAVPFDIFMNIESFSELRRMLTKEEKQEIRRILKEELRYLTRNKE